MTIRIRKTGNIYYYYNISEDIYGNKMFKRLIYNYKTDKYTVNYNGKYYEQPHFEGYNLLDDWLETTSGYKNPYMRGFIKEIKYVFEEFQNDFSNERFKILQKWLSKQLNKKHKNCKYRKEYDIFLNK